MGKVNATTQSVAHAPETACEADAVLVVDQLLRRRELIAGICRDKFEVLAFGNAGEACLSACSREFVAAFLAWELSGPDLLRLAASSADKVIIICETESEAGAATDCLETFFPEVTFEILRSTCGRLTEGAVLAKLPRSKPRPKIAPASGAGLPPGGQGEKAFVFDVFLAAASEDYRRAEKLYWILRKHGLKIFFAPKSLPDFDNLSFHSVIGRVLDRSKTMILVASRAEYLSDRYLEKEWEAYHLEKVTKTKSGRLLVLTTRDVCEEDLPFWLRGCQVIPFHEKNLPKLLAFLRQKKARGIRRAGIGTL